MNLQLKKIDVLAELDETVFTFRERAIKEGIEIIYNAPELPAPMEADEDRIRQVFINIFDNAIKYTPVGSVIEIHTDQKEQWVTVSVSDNGPGIPDAQKPRIFDMFYSGANKVVDSRRSLGLGLSLCKSIVTAHGGTISVSDNQPNGTVFTFTLPAGR